eukprot:9305_1
MGASHSQPDTTNHSLSILFPALNNETIQNTLDTANGDAGKAIVLLIQTPDNGSPCPSPNRLQLLSTEDWKMHQTDSKHKSAFMRQQFGSQFRSFWRHLSILFWVTVAVLLMVLFVLVLFGHIVHSSFAVTMCVCCVIELLFTVGIVYGVITYKIWCIWISLLWSGSHGITAIYSLFTWAHHDSSMVYYVGGIVLYWCLQLACNLMYFIKLNDADSQFNAMIDETANVLEGIHDKNEFNDNEKSMEGQLTPSSRSSVEIKYKISESNEYSEHYDDPSASD